MHPERSHRIMVAVGVIVFAIAIIGGYIMYEMTAAPTVAPSVSDKNLAIDPTVDSTIDSSVTTSTSAAALANTQSADSSLITYKNTKYGFELTLPARWKDYKVIEEKESSLSFQLKKADPVSAGNMYGTIFIVNVFTPAEWETNQNANDPSVNNYLGKNGQYVFGYLKGQDDDGFTGFPPVQPDGSYQGPFYDLKNEIVPSFKVISNTGFVVATKISSATTQINGVVQEGFNELISSVKVGSDVVTGYIWTSNEGSPKFASVTLPAWGMIGDKDFASREYSIDIWDGVKFIFYKKASPFQKVAFPGGGVTKFRVTGISPDYAICPGDHSSVTWGLSFASAGTFNGTRVPITLNLSSEGKSCKVSH